MAQEAIGDHIGNLRGKDVDELVGILGRRRRSGTSARPNSTSRATSL